MNQSPTARAFITDLPWILLILASTGTSYALFGLQTTVSWIITFLYQVVLCVLFAIRRRWYNYAIIAFTIVLTLHLLFGPAFLTGDFVGLALLTTIIARTPPEVYRRWIFVSFIAAILYGCIIAMTIVSHNYSPNTSGCLTQTIILFLSLQYRGYNVQATEFFLPIITLFLICVLVSIACGFWKRNQLATIRLLNERNQALLSSQLREQQLAISKERARIARDMHDVVAHTLSIIIVQADGGKYGASHNLTLAEQTLTIIRQQAQHAIKDMMYLLQVLHTQQPDACDWEHIDTLISQARLTSPDNTLIHTIHGLSAPQRLSSQAQETTYRIVQESLSNIRKHAGSHVRISIDQTWNENGVKFVITNEIHQPLTENHSTNASTAGFGILGMHERIAQVGGLLATQHDEHSFTITATIPYTFDENSTPLFPDTDSSVYNADLPKLFVNIAHHICQHNIHFVSKARTLLTPAKRDASNSSIIKQPQGERNIITRLYYWRTQHWLLSDALISLPFAIFMIIVPTYTNFSIFTYNHYTNYSFRWMLVYRMITVITFICIIYRRKFPESTAGIVAILSALQLILIPELLIVNLAAIVMIYTAILYGRSAARHWVLWAIIINCALLACKYAMRQNSERFLFSNLSYYYMQTSLVLLLQGVSFVLPIGILCLLTMLVARYRRDGSNVMILQARNDALAKESEELKKLAANSERQRISINLQKEITTTLQGVIHSTDEALETLRSYEITQSQETTSELCPEQVKSIMTMFANISTKGRSALAHMRSILCILRTSSGREQSLALRPAPSINQQPEHLLDAETPPLT